MRKLCTQKDVRTLSNHTGWNFHWVLQAVLP
nr:unnamed protein product [Callosobruchus analis]